MQTTTTNRFEMNNAGAIALIEESLKAGATVNAQFTTALGNSLFSRSQTSPYTRVGKLYTGALDGRTWQVMLHGIDR